MGQRLRRVLCSILGVAAALGPASTALADLPRTYEVQRIDSPNPIVNGNFGMSMVNVGDVDGDGEDDLLVGTDKHGSRLGQGQVSVVSGEDGSILRAYALPDVDPGGGPDRRPSGFGNAVARLADLGSCAAFTDDPGDPCPGLIGAPDGFDEHIVAATGVDVHPDTGVANPALTNSFGVVYVFDGGTGALLKRLLLPRADRMALTASVWFGRTVMTPAGRPACTGFGGVPKLSPVPPFNDENKCPYDATSAVARGDLNGGGKADVLVGATDFPEQPALAHPDSECHDPVETDPCTGAGRVYVFYGEDIVAEQPGDALGNEAEDDSKIVTIQNPLAQTDDPAALSPFSAAEEFGMLIIPVGDSGQCLSAVSEPAKQCPTAKGGPEPNASTPDGVPDFAIVANNIDTDIYAEVGEALLLDGQDLSVIKRSPHPDPKPEAAWGLTQNGVVYPAIGDASDDNRPDFYVPEIQWAGANTAQGRGWLVSGRPGHQGSFREFPAIFNDPTPQTGEQFGASAAGVGNLLGSSNTELLIGAIGPHNPGTNPEVVNDVHFFSAVTPEDVLQTIAAPDAQGGEAFGVSVAPLGDLNDDGFLDFAAGAGLYDLADAGAGCAPCTRAGRVYLFRSDNSPLPGPGPAPTPSPTPTATTLAGRSLQLDASRTSVRARREVTLRGVLEAFADPAACQPNQPVEIQRRTDDQTRFQSLATVRTDADGDFAHSIEPTETAEYRARVGQTASCLGAVSDVVGVAVPPIVDLATKATRLVRRAVRFQLRCPDGPICQGTVKLRTVERLKLGGGARRKATLGTRAFQVPGGRRRTTTIKVSRRVAKALRRQGRVRLRAFITGRDEDGNVAFNRERMRLRAG